MLRLLSDCGASEGYDGVDCAACACTVHTIISLSGAQPAADFPIVQPAADFPIFTHVVTSQAQIVVYSPQFSTGSAQA